MKLDPTPGFVVKTATLTGPRTKVFINVCSDNQLPEPDTLNVDEVTRRVKKNENWVVPIVVSPKREDVDKAGKPCVVFDACMNQAVLLLGVRDKGINILIIETCIELVEDSSGLMLDRNYVLPKLRAKGKLHDTEISEADLTRGPRSLERVLEDVKDEVSTTVISGKPPIDGKHQTVKKPVITELKDQRANSFLQAYRGPYSGVGQKPTHELVIYGHASTLQIDGQRVRWDSNNTTELPFVPTSYEAIYTKNDDILHLFLWR